MSIKDYCLNELNSAEEFFNRSTRVFAEEHSGYRPVEGLYSVAGHVMHAAQTLEWFADGTFSPAGFDMDFEKHIREAMEATSLTAARERLASAFRQVREVVAAKTEAELAEPFPEGNVLQGPKWGFAGAAVDHTAHHRGALTVYARLLGMTPPMPYADMPEGA